MATDTSSAYIRSLNESLSHPTGVTLVFAACTVTVWMFIRERGMHGQRMTVRIGQNSLQVENGE
jgi:hypothetical protein